MNHLNQNERIKGIQSMEISALMVKNLREKTGAGMMDCKKALIETQGHFDQAIEFLRKKGIASASQKSGRLTKEGSITSYIHGEGKVGVLLEVNCETDFVARTDLFRQLVKEVSMHIAAAHPRWIQAAEVPETVIQKEKEIAFAQLQEQNTGKPAHVIEKIVEGKIKKFYEDHCLLQQCFIKDSQKTVDQLIKEAIATLGENISIRRFTRYGLGEGLT